MSASWILLGWLGFFVLCPVLTIGDHFVYPPELFIYAMFAIGLFQSKRAARRRAQQELPVVRRFTQRAPRAQFIYAALFLATALFTAHLVGESLNNFDVFILRNIVQVGLCMKLFSDKVSRLDDAGKLDRVIFRALLLLSVPALLVFLQRLDLFGVRGLVIALYKPQFFFLGEATFSSYRYTSVFKDFFTSAVYFTMLGAFLFHFSLRTRLGVVHRLVLIGLLAFVYAAQLFVARTSLVMIPLLMGAIALFGAPLRSGVLIKRVLPIAAVGVMAAAVVVPQLLNGGLVNSRWAMEGLKVFSNEDRAKSTSFTTMQRWYEQMYSKAFEGRYSLFEPHHSYDLTEREEPGIYTDSFYGQELYRYGVYGALAYLAYLALMAFAAARASRFTLILVCALAVMNYKGGNTFFMVRDVYLYAFILAVAPYLEHRRQRAARAATAVAPAAPVALPAAA